MQETQGTNAQHTKMLVFNVCTAECTAVADVTSAKNILLEDDQYKDQLSTKRSYDDVRYPEVHEVAAGYVAEWEKMWTNVAAWWQGEPLPNMVPAIDADLSEEDSAAAHYYAYCMPHVKATGEYENEDCKLHWTISDSCV